MTERDETVRWRTLGSRLPALIGWGVLGLLVVLMAWIGPDAVRAIPWRLRWWAGELTLIGFLIGIPVLAVRRGWARPWTFPDPSPSPRLDAHRAVAIGLQAITGSLAFIPFLRDGYRTKHDWDFLNQHYEALRQSVREYGQVPWWNPWNVGGFPLLGEPQVAPLSPGGVLVFLVGTEWGVWLATIVALMLGVEGARRLARLWLDRPEAVAVTSVVYGWNGLIVMFTVSCPALAWCYWYLPWFLWAAFRLGEGRAAAVRLGLLLGIAGNGLIQYPTAYTLIATGAILGIGWLATPTDRLRLTARIGLAVGICLALAGWRLALVGGVMSDYPRRLYTPLDPSLLDLLRSLVTRSQPPPWTVYPNETAESSAYLGIVPLSLAVWSLRRGPRWWHVLSLAAFALSLGTVRWYHLSFWVKDWPVFSTMHLVGRWRVVGSLGVALAAGDAIQDLRGRLSPRWRWVALGASIWIVADLGVYLYQLLPRAFDLPVAAVEVPGPPLPRGWITQVESTIVHGYPHDYEANRDGYGVVRGYEPLLDYDRGRETARRWRGHPEYVGEFWSGEQPVEPVRWSPNRIEFGLRPGQEIELNMNPGSWWVVNGARPFSERRCVEVRERFRARADDRGRLVLEARPPHLGLALAVTLVGIGLIAATASASRGRRAL